MSIFGIGIDLVEVARIEKAVKRQGKRFLQTVYTERERKFCLPRRNRYLSLSARFAAKEAFLKALGTGFSKGISWREVEVLDNEHSRPTFNIEGKAKKLLGKRKVHLSISHIKDYATAVVVIEK
jgi:holo-[acyl-carrier protein] synthase